MIVDGCKTIQIAFSFSPKEIKEYSALIVINMYIKVIQNESIQFQTPIKGIAEMTVTNQVFSINTVCK